MPDDDENKDEKSEEEKGTRMDAAKAFFRAMYAGDESAGSSSSEGGTDSRRVKELEQQVAMLEQKATEFENLYKRLAADFDNFRRRMERDKEEFANAGVRKAAEAIIPALDDLDRAQMYLNKDTPTEKLLESFQLISTRIMQCLEQAGLKRLNTSGGVLFDPRYHEPVQQIESETLPDQTIMHELRGGYMLGERVIRPALVNVALNTKMDMPPVEALQKEAPAPAPAPVQEPAPAAAPEQTKSAEQSNSSSASSESTTASSSSTESKSTKNDDELAKAAQKSLAGETEEGSRIFDLGDMDDIT